MSYPVPEARPHEPSVRIDDGWAMMPVDDWVAYCTLSAGFFLALTEIADTFEIDWHEAQLIACQALGREIDGV